MFDRLRNGLNKLINKFKFKTLDENSLREPVQELINLMIQNEVGVEVAEEIGKKLKKELIQNKTEYERFRDPRPMLKEGLRRSIRSIIEPEKRRDLVAEVKQKVQEGDPYVIVIMGINGTGKTTTLAKLAYMLQNKGFSVVFSASDTFRAGAIDQLTKHGENLKIKTIAHQKGGDPTAVAIDALDHAYSKGIDVVMIDTAGRMQNNYNLMQELRKLVEKTEPDIKIFIGDSLAGNDVIRQAQTFDEVAGIDGVIMTKADSDVKGGATLSVSKAIGKPIMYLGVGQSYDDLKEFNADVFVDQLIP